MLRTASYTPPVACSNGLPLHTSCIPTRSSTRKRAWRLSVRAAVEPGALVLVAGASGGVGQVVTAKLLEKGYKVRALCRNKEKAEQLFPPDQAKALEVIYADLREPAGAKRAAESVDAVCCVTGTTAFPSRRWRDNNGPEQTDYVSVKNLIEASPKDLKRFVLNTSVGVERFGSFPFFILNAFGVLKFKREAEKLLQASGLPYTIMRPGRLTDGPWTSSDLNTLLRATSGSRQAVQLSPRDDLNGEASRIAVAEALVQALGTDMTENRTFAIASSEGDGPGSDAAQWQALFKAAS